MTQQDFVAIQEGQAEILFPNSNEVFYNPVQEFNRDMSIAVIKTWAEIFREEKTAQWQKKKPDQDMPEFKFKVLEALSASGLRSIRYAKELGEGLDYVVANDMSEDAVNLIRRNALHNHLDDTILRPNCDDACDLMYRSRSHKNHFDVVDLDPYGTASPFLDGAIQCIADGGLLCVTCTDLAVLAGNYPETCYAKYGSVPLHGEFCHEGALRYLLNAIQLSASRYKRYIVPVISCSIDFYIRVFVRVFVSPAEVKKAFSRTSMMLLCTGCKSFHLSPLGSVQPTEKGGVKYVTGRLLPHSTGSRCEECGGNYQIGGPLWGAPIHQKEFVSRLLNNLNDPNAKGLYTTHPRMLGMVTVISEELDAPLYYTYGGISGTAHCTNPPLVKFNSALLNAGYKVSSSHCNSNAFKTDAPARVIWDVMRAWIKLNPLNLAKRPENDPIRKILAKETTTDVSFELHPDANPVSRRIKLVRFEHHRGQNWGPKARAKKRPIESQE